MPRWTTFFLPRMTQVLVKRRAVRAPVRRCRPRPKAQAAALEYAPQVELLWRLRRCGRARLEIGPKKTTTDANAQIDTSALATTLKR